MVTSTGKKPWPSWTLLQAKTRATNRCRIGGCSWQCYRSRHDEKTDNVSLWAGCVSQLKPATFDVRPWIEQCAKCDASRASKRRWYRSQRFVMQAVVYGTTLRRLTSGWDPKRLLYSVWYDAQKVDILKDGRLILRGYRNHENKLWDLNIVNARRWKLHKHSTILSLPIHLKLPIMLPYGCFQPRDVMVRCAVTKRDG